MDIIEKYGLEGLAIGALTFVIIGVFHPLVSKGEYYFGTRIWWFFSSEESPALPLRSA